MNKEVITDVRRRFGDLGAGYDAFVPKDSHPVLRPGQCCLCGLKSALSHGYKTPRLWGARTMKSCSRNSSRMPRNAGIFRDTTARTSPITQSGINRVKAPDRAMSRSRASGPLQIMPENMMLVSIMSVGLLVVTLIPHILRGEPLSHFLQ